MAPHLTADEQSPRHWETRWIIHKGDAQLECTLIDQGPLGVDVQLCCSGKWSSTHRCQSRDVAVAEADELKEKTLRTGGVLVWTHDLMRRVASILRQDWLPGLSDRDYHRYAEMILPLVESDAEAIATRLESLEGNIISRPTSDGHRRVVARKLQEAAGQRRADNASDRTLTRKPRSSAAVTRH